MTFGKGPSIDALSPNASLKMTRGIGHFRRWMLYASLVLPWLAGCAAFKPMNGVPARYVPDDMKVGRRNGKRTIDLSLLSQKWDNIHRVDSGDVLAIYIGGILGKIDENPQVQFPQNSDFQPAAGVPVTVREDGSISLPMIKSLPVRGLTTQETEEAIRRAYTNHAAASEFLKPGQERILVSLQRPRQTHVMVVRQDSRNEPIANAAVGQLNIGTAKRGTGKVVSLPAYQNDVLHALVATDGLPGLDAENAVYIIRRQVSLGAGLPNGMTDPAALIRQSKQREVPIVRGQSSDIWRDPPDFSTGNPYADPSGSYRQQSSRNGSSDSFQGVRQSVDSSGQNEPSWNPNPFKNDYERFPSTPLNTGNQMPSEPQRPLGSQQNSRNMSPNDVAPTAYQPNQYSPNGRSSYGSTPPNNGNPTPLQGRSNPYANLADLQSNQPNAGGMPLPQPNSNFPNPQNWMPPAPAAGSPYGPPANSGPGYSLPNAPPQSAPPQQGYDAGNYGLQNDLPNFDLPFDFGSNGFNGGSSNPNTVGNGLVDGQRIIRIPIRLGPDEQVDIRNEDIILHEGDIVFIESRDTEVFFTGGLLGGGQYTLPRDYDLDILQALSIATSRVGAAGAARQIGGVSALNSDVTISPSNVIIIRKLPEGGEVPIKIDLYQARSDLSERLIVQPGDYIYLQYTPLEAVAAFLDRHLLEGALFGLFTQQLTKTN